MKVYKKIVSKSYYIQVDEQQSYSISDVMMEMNARITKLESHIELLQKRNKESEDKLRLFDFDETKMKDGFTFVFLKGKFILEKVFKKK